MDHGRFLKLDFFTFTDLSRKSYKGYVFLFDECIIYTTKYHTLYKYKGHNSGFDVALNEQTLSFHIYETRRFNNEVTLTTTSNEIFNTWKDLFMRRIGSKKFGTIIHRSQSAS